MMRSIKLLGVLAVAALGMSAMIASSASAATLTTGETPSTHTVAEDLHAVQYGEAATDNHFNFNGQSVTCSNAETTYTVEEDDLDKDGTAHEMIVEPHYRDCGVLDENDNITLPTTVTMNGCYYTFNEPVGSGTTFTGTVDLLCPEEKEVVLHTYLFGGVTSHSVNVCTTTLGEQKGLGEVVYHNIAGDTEPNHDHVTVTVNIKDTITGNQHGTCGEAEDTEADYTSTLTLTSDTDDVWISSS